MALHRLKDYYPDYQKQWDNSEIKNLDSYDVYTSKDNKVGSVKDLLVDDSGRFRYAVVDTGPWIFGKNVLLPIGLARFDYNSHRMYVEGLSKDQVENLPEYKPDQMIDDRYEQRVREQYRPIAQNRTGRQYINRGFETEQPVERSQAVETSTPVEADAVAYNRTARDTVYDREPSYYGMSEAENQRPLTLYEERLITTRHRDKVGQVRVGKHVETETAEVVEPIEKERVIVERRDATGQPAAKGHNFKDEEVARVDVYEERVDVEKQPFVKENVSVRKETERETVRAKEKVRREELDIDTDGNPNVRR